MSISLSQVYAYLDAHPIRQYPGEISSLLEMLFSIYTEANNIDTDSIREKYRSVDEILSKLPIRENDQIFDITTALCLEYEQTAFVHGISVGMHLMTEINMLL